MGVFANARIKKGEKVATFGGFVIDMRQLSKLEKENLSQFNTIMEIGYQVDDQLVYAPVKKDQFSTIEYLNHSCDPNCGFDGPIDLVAMRDIRAGEEICMDYAMCISNKLFEMPCTCGSSNCRKKVKSTDWKDPDIQRKYRSFFQPYLNRKISALKNKRP